MSKVNLFVCSNCGEEFSKWQGKCTNCNNWNTLKEIKIQSFAKPTKFEPQVHNLSEVKPLSNSRIDTKINELDRVLGGGIVSGSIVLIGGDPGIGKSTLLLQVAEKVGDVMYVSGEESAEQIKMRADRLKLKSDKIKIATETNIDAVIAAISQSQPKLAIIDSIQTMYSEQFPSTAGSLVQVRETALRLQKFAKQSNIPIILVGHMTKEGSVAGPKTLEHMVDVVMYLEGDRYQNLRILRSIKNRFGGTDEIGIFEINANGLVEIDNPSKIFLGDRTMNTPGSAVTATIEGTRPFLVEIQALVSETNFGYPKRTASGFDLNRLNLIIAILVNRGGLNLGSSDIYLNIAGGYYLKEPAADLAVALSIASAFKNKPFNSKTIAFGELGLNGEIRAVNLESKRLAEAKRLGFTSSAKGKTLRKLIEELNNV